MIIPRRSSRQGSLRGTSLIGELLEQHAQRTGRVHPLRKRQAQRDTSLLQLESLRIAADAAPVAIGGVEQLRRIKPQSVGMIRIHVCKDARLCRNEVRSIV